jgi:hypothetical protein
MKYLRFDEVTRSYGLTASEIEMLEREQLIDVKRTLDDEPVISSDDAETARLVMLLMNELEVNLPGAEVIAHMRAEMIAMQRQFGKILEALIEELRRSLPITPPEHSSE